MNLSDLLPFDEAIQSHAAKIVTPTKMGSAQLRVLDAAIKRQSFFSANTMFEDLLQGYKDDVESIINPQQITRDDRVTEENLQGNVTVGLNPAQARANARALLQKLGYEPAAEDAGTIRDLSSDARINLVLKTNVETAQGAGHFIQQNDENVVDDYPALELVRFEQREKPRDWEQRWREAARYSGDNDAYACLENSGRMVALKSSPIWDALGSSALFPDALDNPYPPFAFNSGMWTQDVARDDAIQLGLLDSGDKAEPNPLDIEKLFSFAA